MARMIFGALQDTLLVKRTTGDMTQLEDVVMALKAQLSSGQSGKAAKLAASRQRRR